MGRFIFSLFFISACCCLDAQNYIISFTASGESSTISSVHVLNLSQKTTLELNGSDVLQLVGVTGTMENGLRKDQIIVYPNPSGQPVIIEFSNSGKGPVHIRIVTISGEVIIQKVTEIKEGRIRCEISGLKTGIYLFSCSVAGNNYTERIIITSEDNGNPDIRFQYTDVHLQNHGTLKAATSLVQMQYNEGERLLFKGVSGNYTRIIAHVPVQNAVLNFDFKDCTDGESIHYPVVTIGSQTWMAENLRTTKYNDEAGIPLVEDAGSWSGLSTPGYCWYDNNQENNSIYGALYNWYAVNTGKLCPVGWHVPTHSEWGELVSFLANSGYSGIEGTVIKSIYGWSNGTDYYGFGATPTGFRSPDGTFYSFSTLTFWWSSTPGAFNINGRRLMNNTTILESYGLAHNGGYTIRCIKDNE